jgi:hypothetical protein
MFNQSTSNLIRQNTALNNQTILLKNPSILDNDFILATFTDNFVSSFKLFQNDFHQFIEPNTNSNLLADVSILQGYYLKNSNKVPELEFVPASNNSYSFDSIDIVPYLESFIELTNSSMNVINPSRNHIETAERSIHHREVLVLFHGSCIKLVRTVRVSHYPYYQEAEIVFEEVLTEKTIKLKVSNSTEWLLCRI